MTSSNCFPRGKKLSLKRKEDASNSVTEEANGTFQLLMHLDSRGHGLSEQLYESNRFLEREIRK